MGLFTGRTRRAPCTVEVSHTFEALHAHVRLDDGTTVGPGDEVVVEGAPVLAAYGEAISEARTAVVHEASALRRLWVRATGDLEIMELCEFSFTEAHDATEGVPGIERAAPPAGAPA